MSKGSDRHSPDCTETSESDTLISIGSAYLFITIFLPNVCPYFSNTIFRV